MLLQFVDMFSPFCSLCHQCVWYVKYIRDSSYRPGHYTVYDPRVSVQSYRPGHYTVYDPRVPVQSYRPGHYTVYDPWVLVQSYRPGHYTVYDPRVPVQSYRPGHYTVYDCDPLVPVQSLSMHCEVSWKEIGLSTSSKAMLFLLFT